MVGTVLAVCGCLSTVVFGMAGVFRATATREPVTDRIRDVGTFAWIPNSITWAALGFALVGGAIAYIAWYDRRSRSGPRETKPNTRVLGRYGINANGDYMHNSWEFEFAEFARYFVQLQTGPGRVSEYECDASVFWQCGEGMWGEAEFQRKWLGRFTPYVGLPPDQDVTDPFLQHRNNP
jgi:hypothetical protein